LTDHPKQGWQRKLTQLNIAAFPWDPKIEPPVNNTPPVPVAVANPSYSEQDAHGYTDSQLSLPNNGPPIPQHSVHHAMPVTADQVVPPPPIIKNEPGVAAKSDPVIKQEPGLQQTTPVHPPVPPFSQAQLRGPNLAAQRAINSLGSQFGSKAAQSINAITTGMTQAAGFGQAPGGAPQGPQSNGQSGPPLNPRQYQQQMALQQQRASQQALNAVSQRVGKSQVDGSADDEAALDGIVLRREPTGVTAVLGRVEIDGLLYEQIARTAKQMEGGGLMLPLRKATKHKGVSGKKRRPTGPAQQDGPDDDALIKDEDEEDADAINSDLDDPEENMDDDDEDDDAMGQIMLCTWDKVQRVKNKW
jgi:transcription initiation factor TFIIA large subunit